MDKYFFIGGAPDPEMRMIEKVVRKAGLPFIYATVAGNPCHPGNAYKADSVKIPAGYRLVVVECELENIREFPNAIRIDHHRPQDPGFHMGASEYLEAASIGQVYHLLGIEPTQAARVMAAFDHCFPAAFRGECSGVLPREVLSIKVTEIAGGTNSSEEDVLRRINFFRSILAGTPEEKIGNQILKDLRSRYLGEGYSLDLLAAQVAVIIEGCAAILRHRDRVDDPEKVSITGHNTPETVRLFMDTWAPEHGLTRIYGVPARGYAGGYIK